ncbi:ABC transporter ATP-binding protein [Bifidobacterium amazonense]|uniref:ABC transporter ATP-binding protein n=1 Tax=Bifidobacterium amazonense TaxID=2809027 RepID=A0ABS9VXU8_9BIFI|nr:ABC transporter ATP-binding protein [Bifidobacterium amazonense]MCH9276944.1 ABC transporter ATP-binding protein [Bifidobacterium amazonense]
MDDMVNPTAIEAIDLVKDYGEGDTAVHALRGVNVRFEQGRFTAIMGPSGSGKSTLMHTLAGLDSATSGRIIFDGADITTMNDNQLTLLRRHRIGFIFQSFNLLPMFSAEQNILMPLTLAGEKPDRRWFDQLVRTLGLKERLDHRPNELSGGQQQRVAIARALITKPSLVFADEPTGNLDSVSSAEVLSFLKQSVKELGQTIIMVTHDAVAASYADRAIVFADGRIVADVPHPNAEQMNELLMAERERATRAAVAPSIA